MPHELTHAIGYAQMVLGWHEGLPKDKLPPEWMWTVDHELEIWFEKLDEERDQGSSRDVSAGPMLENELAADMRKRR